MLEYWLVDCEAGLITVFERREGRFDAGHCYERNQQLDLAVLETSFAVSELLP